MPVDKAPLFSFYLILMNESQLQKLADVAYCTLTAIGARPAGEALLSQGGAWFMQTSRFA